MDYQQLFNIALGIAAFLGGWVMNNITKAIDRLDSDIRAMPHNYVGKDDYRQDIKEIKVLMHQIFDKLENKADK